MTNHGHVCKGPKLGLDLQPQTHEPLALGRQQYSRWLQGGSRCWGQMREGDGITLLSPSVTHGSVLGLSQPNCSWGFSPLRGAAVTRGLRFTQPARELLRPPRLLLPHAGCHVLQRFPWAGLYSLSPQCPGSRLCSAPERRGASPDSQRFPSAAQRGPPRAPQPRPVLLNMHQTPLLC